MKRILVILPFLFIVGCASVATGIDTARNVVATSDVVSTTAEVTAGVVDTIGDEVKDQAKELEVKEPDFPTGELKDQAKEQTNKGWL